MDGPPYITFSRKAYDAQGTHWHVEEIQISGSSQHMWS